jgi:hypothetical protein
VHRHGAARREREHAVADVDAVHLAGRTDEAGDRLGEQPGTGADVEHPLAGRRPELLEGDAALLDQIGRAVDLLEAAGRLLVELQHGAS